MSNYMKIPKITLRAARVNANMTQKCAAKHLGINVSTLQKYESGKLVPGWDIVNEIEELYKYPVSHIFFDCNSRNKRESP